MGSEITVESKKCSRCKRVKKAHLMVRSASSPDGLSYMCRSCSRKLSAELRDKDPKRREYDRWIARTQSRAMAILRDRHPEEFARIKEEVRQKEPAPS